MWSTLGNIFTGGAVRAIENIATEMIETDKESAEAKAIMVKTLDPNGMMRRDISCKVSSAYMGYLTITMLLVIAHSFNVGNGDEVKDAITSLTDLFVPITTMFTAITGASFGVNMTNSIKGR
jgi:hypothetical protein